MALRYPKLSNRLMTEHPEWYELMYVLSIAITEVQSARTPSGLKRSYNNDIVRLKQLIPYRKIRPIKELKIHKNDPQNIQNLKFIGNNILKQETAQACAWAFNITKLYERYVQYIFDNVMFQLGGRALCNNKFSISGELPRWSLRYLEPDIILRFRDREVIVDAKYKSHMMNLGSNTDRLRTSFREDLHQVLAYSSISDAKEKTIIFCYPCNNPIHKELTLKSPLNNCQTKIYLLGIPVNIKHAASSIDYIYTLLSKSK